jgi:hypothetical protein
MAGSSTPVVVSTTPPPSIMSPALPPITDMERRNAGSASGTPAQAVPSQGQGKSTSIRRVRRALLRDLGWVPVGKGLVFVSPITSLRQRSNQHKTASCAADHIPAQSTATHLLTPLTTSTRIYRLWDETRMSVHPSSPLPLESPSTEAKHGMHPVSVVFYVRYLPGSE